LASNFWHTGPPWKSLTKAFQLSILLTKVK